MPKPRATYPASPPALDTTKFINASQIGGVSAYTIDNGEGRGVRVFCVNTGGGLRYRVLGDRGLDIDEAFLNQHSLAFLTHRGVTVPSRALDRGIEWLKGFPGGLLTSCGSFNIGAPGVDDGEELGLHGPHSNTVATIESVVQPDPWRSQTRMAITGIVRYGRLFGPCLELRRTIASSLGGNTIEFIDEFFNAGNQPVPHAWLLHINFGYPLVDAGTELCYHGKVEPLDRPEAQARFRAGADFKRVPPPLDAHRGSTEAVAYLYPRPIDRSGRTTVGIVNQQLGIGVAVHYSTKEFPRCVNWQHWGPGEYVTALEPSTASVEGRAKDREEGNLQFIEPGARKTYTYQIEIVTTRDRLADLRKLNVPAR